MTKTIGIYLAGPEVFLPNAKEILTQKSDIASDFGFIPIAPGDADIPSCETKLQHGIAISAYDEKLMRSADAIVANLTPFRGISADTGTCFELGYMSALGRHVCAYTNDTKSFFKRVCEYYKGEISIDDAGSASSTSDGLHIEDFDMIDNLMMHGSVESRGGFVEKHQASTECMFTDLTAYRRVIERLAKDLF